MGAEDARIERMAWVNALWRAKGQSWLLEPPPRPIAYLQFSWYSPTSEWVWETDRRCAMCGKPAWEALCYFCRFGPPRERGPDWQELQGYRRPSPYPIQLRAQWLREHLDAD